MDAQAQRRLSGATINQQPRVLQHQPQGHLRAMGECPLQPWDQPRAGDSTATAATPSPAHGTSWGCSPSMAQLQHCLGTGTTGRVTMDSDHGEGDHRHSDHRQVTMGRVTTESDHGQGDHRPGDHRAEHLSSGSAVPAAILPSWSVWHHGSHTEGREQ